MTFTPEELRLLQLGDSLMEEDLRAERRRAIDPALVALQVWRRERREARERAAEAARAAVAERRLAARAEAMARRERRNRERSLRRSMPSKPVREVGPRWIDRAVQSLVADGLDTVTRLDDRLRAMGAGKMPAAILAALERLQARDLVSTDGQTWSAVVSLEMAS